MRKYVILILVFLFSFKAYGQCLGGENSLFYYDHTKGKSCAQVWGFVEDLIKKKNSRCEHLALLPGFPYLRGNEQVLKLASKIKTKYSGHKWLELLRRIDLQARYKELDSLPQKDLEAFCTEAQIDCFWGRIRAYIARCSAIMMGDEKRNHDYMEKVKASSLDALKHIPDKGIACFKDTQTLDGLLGDDSLVEIFQPASGGINPGYLKRRIQGSKKITGGRPY